MSISEKEKIIFTDIQKKLFYMIPEKWEAIYLYASIIEQPSRKPVGEMYFYYLPKGILKRKPVNVYQIPAMFNIDEESYNEIIQSLYLSIKNLKTTHREYKDVLWTNLTITIKDYKFKIEYGYEDLGKNSEFNPYERHVIWRYKNLELDSDLQTKEEKAIIDRYLKSDLIQFEKENIDGYVESSYTQPVRNIIDYEKTLTVEAAIASQNQPDIEKPKKEKKPKNNDLEEKVKIFKQDEENQILFGRVEKMKQMEKEKNRKEEIDDDIVLSSDFMTKKD